MGLCNILCINLHLTSSAQHNLHDSFIYLFTAVVLYLLYKLQWSIPFQQYFMMSCLLLYWLLFHFQILYYINTYSHTFLFFFLVYTCMGGIACFLAVWFRSLKDNSIIFQVGSDFLSLLSGYFTWNYFNDFCYPYYF